LIAQLLMLALAAAEGFASDRAWVCETDVAQMCGEDGCVSEARPAEITFYPGAKIYRSCVDDDCLDGTANFFAYGGTMLVTFDDEPSYARIFPDLTFVELTAAGETLQISRGSCRQDASPAADTTPALI
jgi:hypothetical protein